MYRFCFWGGKAASAAFGVKKQVHYPHFVFWTLSSMSKHPLLCLCFSLVSSLVYAQDGMGDGNAYDSGGGSYQNLGGNTYAPGGGTYQQEGSTIQSDTGTTYQTDGGLVLGTDGSEYQTTGNTTYNFDGTSCLNSGSATNCD
jgi:hypothetical protein